MYIYPENLNIRATIWLWTLKDAAISGILLLLGVAAMAELNSMFLLVVAATYAFVTVRIEDNCIRDYIIYACRFFFGQRRFVWAVPDKKGET